MSCPSAGPGARAGSPGVRESLIGTPSRRTGRSAPGWSISTTMSRARTSSESSASSRSSTGSRQQSCSPANARPLVARPLREDRLDLALRLAARSGRGGARSGPRARRRGRTPARTSAPARRASRSRRRSGRAGNTTSPPASSSPPRCGVTPSASIRAATIASHDSAPSAIETSTSWPSPETSRSRSATRIPTAAISAPPPRSAIWPAAWTGGPSRSPVSPSSPTSPR